MRNNSTYTCRLCFGIDDISGEEIEDIHKEILDVLLINIDWSLTETPTLCENCCKKLHESFTFKANCIDIEDYLTPIKDNGKLDLRKVCTLPKHSKAVDLICRLCVEWIDDQDVTLTEKEKERFKLYLPEIDLESTSNPVICSVCYDSFKSCLSFTESCIQNEQKLVDYCKKLKMTIESPIFLNEFLEYQESPNSSTRVCHLNRKVKSEKLDDYKCDICSYTSISVTDIEAHKVSHVNSCQQHDFDADLKIFIKEEYINELDRKVKSEKLDDYKCDICSYTSISVTDIEAHKVSHVNSCQQHDFDADLKIFIKEEYINELDRKVKSEKLDDYKCDICSYTSISVTDIEAHKVSHVNSCQQHDFDADLKIFIKEEYINELDRKVKSEKLDDYKCDICSYTSISVTDIEAHKVSHVNSSQQHDFHADLKIFIKDEYISELDSKVKSEKLDEYKCDICSYTSISVTDIEAHKVSHVNSSQQHDFDADLKIFIKEEYISELANRTQECSPYNFETSDEWGLDRHIIGMDHKNSNVEEEKTVYIPQKTLVCSVCDYQTSRPSNLKQHMVKHLDTPSFKCDECSFESKWAHSLSNHKIIHRNPSEVDMFKCEECPFESKWSTSLISHKKIHRKPSEVNVFKCDECPYECKRNDRLSDHKKKHREPSELNMFKCEECPFESKRAHNLSVHKKMHRKPSEVNMFKCDECPFESKWARSLTSHKIIHRKPSEMNMFKCDECPYESKRIDGLSRHKKIHRKPSEVNMFKCDECPFESKWAGSLTSHKIIHRKPSEMKIFKCDECPFESKWAKSLICHEKIHLKPSEVNMFKCDECPFESKWANSLNNHKQIHRKPSEVNIDG